MQKFKLLSYNIHKGFTAGNRNFVLKAMRDAMQSLQVDIACLQEVVGHHAKHGSYYVDWQNTSQYEFLAHNDFPYFAYGRNAIYPDGNHGNAILSKKEIIGFENEDVSLTKIERRGLLHAIIKNETGEHPLHVFCLHLGLFEKDRKLQVARLSKRIAKEVDPRAPLVIAGDFNDWRENIASYLSHDLELKEVYFESSGRHARTFPAFLPVFPLDRIYYKNLRCVAGGALNMGTWSKLSDHLPLFAEFEL